MREPTAQPGEDQSGGVRGRGVKARRPLPLATQSSAARLAALAGQARAGTSGRLPSSAEVSRARELAGRVRALGRQPSGLP